MIAKHAGDMLVASDGKYTTTKSGDTEVCKGAFTSDPAKTPKTLDNMAADGDT